MKSNQNSAQTLTPLRYLWQLACPSLSLFLFFFFFAVFRAETILMNYNFNIASISDIWTYNKCVHSSVVGRFAIREQEIGIGQWEICNIATEYALESCAEADATTTTQPRAFCEWGIEECADESWIEKRTNARTHQSVAKFNSQSGHTSGQPQSAAIESRSRHRWGLFGKCKLSLNTISFDSTFRIDM